MAAVTRKYLAETAVRAVVTSGEMVEWTGL